MSCERAYVRQVKTSATAGVVGVEREKSVILENRN